MKQLILVPALLVTIVLPVQAGLFITEVAPWGSGSTPYAVDWFEVSNTGPTAVNIANWRIDDSSPTFGTSAALSGITSIGIGESVLFLETATPGTTIPTFLSTWFGANVPAGLQVGSYSGSGVGLSTTADAVNLFDTNQAIVASVSFGNTTSAAPFRSLDNAARLNNTTISQMSAAGANGSFIAANDASETGSPGTAVPEPSTPLALLTGAFLLILRRRRG